MDIRQLNALVAVADTGSFSGAAAKLATVQSNISTHVRNLERELGAVLIERASGELTPAGELAVARARRVAGEIEALTIDVAALDRDVAGTARLGMIGTTARWLVPLLFDVLPQRYPLLRMIFVEATTEGLNDQLAQNTVDLAVLRLPVPGADLSTTPLFEEDLVLVVNAQSEDGFPDVAGIPDLDGLPLILPIAGTSFRDELDAAARAAGVTLIALAEVDSTRLIASLTFEGLGAAILPATAVPPYMLDRWRLVPVAGLPRRLVGIAQRRRGLPAAPIRAVLDTIMSIVFNPDLVPAGLHPVPPDSVRVPLER